MEYKYQVVTLQGATEHTLPQLLVRYEQEGNETGKHLRDELQGQPKLKGLCGPMYNGEHDGVTCIRYETWGAYDRYSR